MIKKMNLPYKYEDNDASASAFGWEFQQNAGIFLFLSYIESAEFVAIESKNQDIELVLNDRKIYAQAKALQNENTVGTENKKFRDAIVSLAKTVIQTEDELLYVSNLKAPIDNERDKFRNRIVSYNECDADQKSFINEQFNIIIENLNKKTESEKLKESAIKKIRTLIERLESFNKEKLLISSIYPFTFSKDKDIKIKEKTIEVLTNQMGINSEQAVGIALQVLHHWQSIMKYSCIAPDKHNDQKSINKKDLVWTVVAVVSDNQSLDIVANTLNSAYDDELLSSAERYLKDENNLYHERFEFLNKVMQSYEEFKKTVSVGNRSDLEFISCDEWKKYIYEFEDIDDAILQEFIIKCYMYKIVNKNKVLQKIYKGVNICI